MPGFVLAGSGLALVLYALSLAPLRGWGDPVIIGTGAGGLAAVAAFVAIELRSPAPLLNLRLLGNSIFRTTSLVAVFGLGIYYGFLFILPEFLQQARGASALNSGLTTFPGAVGLLLNAQIAARIYPRIGPRRLAVGACVSSSPPGLCSGLSSGSTPAAGWSGCSPSSAGPAAPTASSPSRPPRSRPSPRPPPAARPPVASAQPREGSTDGG